ncbi:MAG: DNA methyltransferase [Candidatus Paceibacterota bacterium]|jgi:site-specific DNA-methyltransferase (adenine-specific)
MQLENQIIKGDCLDVLKRVEDQSVDLIYLDPPFFTQRRHSQKTRDNAKEYAFEDVWDDIHQYTSYLESRMRESRRVLKDSGSLFLHCDKKAVHHLRVMLDKVFGEENFRSEIIWTYRRWSNSKEGLLNAHQNILFYSKTAKFKFNKILTDYSPTTNLDQILQARERNGHNKSVYKRDVNGEVVLGKEKLGVPLSDVWDIPFLNPKAEERVGYPTQKPVILLEKIISLASHEGDVILDPFCGSGTTLVAALLLGRKYIGIDTSKEAVELTKKRLLNPIKTESHLLRRGKDAYINKDESIRTILFQMDANVVQRNKGIDGFLKQHYKGRPVAVYIQRPEQSFSDALSLLKKASDKKGVIRKVLVRTNVPSGIAVKIDSELQNEDIVIIDHPQHVM